MRDKFYTAAKNIFDSVKFVERKIDSRFVSGEHRVGHENVQWVEKTIVKIPAFTVADFIQ